VPVGTDVIPADSPIEVTQVADVTGAIKASFGLDPRPRGR
jgi:hypothetical protein